MVSCKPPKPSSPCLCQSGATWGACCGPLHRGAPAPTALSLMRSRFSAFAVGDVDYLALTLHPDHDDAKLPRDELRALLRKSVHAAKYLGLTILSDSEEGEHATVSFAVRVFQKGRDVSFRETSQFIRTAEGWRYVRGEPSPGASSPD